MGGNSNWIGGQSTVTNGVSGAWIQGTYAAPFSVSAWVVLGYSYSSSTPFYLMGSNDGGVTFANVSMVPSSSPLCSAPGAPAPSGNCGYYTSLVAQPAFSIYRAVTQVNNYNYVVTLLH